MEAKSSTRRYSSATASVSASRSSDGRANSDGRQCREGVPPFSRDRLAYEWEASYFACTEDKTCAGAYQVELYIDASGKVVRMTWSLAPMH